MDSNLSPLRRNDDDNSKKDILRSKVLLQMALFAHTKALKEAVQRIKKEKASTSNISNFFKVFESKPKIDEATKVMNYWGTETMANQTENEELKRKAALVVQTKVRLWLLWRKREISRRYVDDDVSKNIIIVQSAIRRWKAKKAFEIKMEEKFKSDINFDKFCFLLHRGIELGMFSRKYGTVNKRKFKLDNELRCLTYKTSKFGLKNADLRSIYKVTKGLSGYRYTSRAKHPGSCFSLHIKGGRVIDFEAHGDKNEFKSSELIAGFDRLITFLNGSESPFYLNEIGVPCRAGPSIIAFALGRHEAHESLKNQQRNLNHHDSNISTNLKKMTSILFTAAKLGDGRSALIEDSNDHLHVYSIADEMRFRTALQALGKEYENWTKEEQENNTNTQQNVRNSTVNRVSSNSDTELDDEFNADVEDDNHIIQASPGTLFMNNNNNSNNGETSPYTRNLVRQASGGGSSVSSSQKKTKGVAVLNNAVSVMDALNMDSDQDDSDNDEGDGDGDHVGGLDSDGEGDDEEDEEEDDGDDDDNDNYKNRIRVNSVFVKRRNVMESGGDEDELYATHIHPHPTNPTATATATAGRK
eukprot:gene1208-2348_t